MPQHPIGWFSAMQRFADTHAHAVVVIYIHWHFVRLFVT